MGNVKCSYKYCATYTAQWISVLGLLISKIKDSSFSKNCVKVFHFLLVIAALSVCRNVDPVLRDIN